MATLLASQLHHEIYRAYELTDIAIQLWPAPYLERSILEKYKKSRQTPSDIIHTEEDHLTRGDDNTKRLYVTLKNNVL